MIRPWRDWTITLQQAMQLLVLALTLLLIGCTDETTPKPTTSHIMSEQSIDSKTVSGTVDGSEPASGSSPMSGSFPLELWSPQDGSETEIGVVRVMGKTKVDAAVAVNGIPVDIASDGTFQRDLRLDEGSNLIEVAAADLSGQTAYESVAVFSMVSTEEPPLSLFFPPSDLEVREAKVPVFGGTGRDAVVMVNGSLVGLNSLGIFATEVALERGGNLIEIISADAEQRISYRRVEVFSLQ